MNDNRDAATGKPPLIALMDWIGVSESRRMALANFVGWFKQPSNLLSVAAIVAVVIVPWIEKVVKADEDRRAKIDSLLETTNKVIAMNQQRFAPSSGDVLGSAILAAQRENELARANAIAEPIRHEVYPAVLFALSNELCVSGRFDEARGYLDDVLKRGTGIHFLATRPSIDELSQAHVVSAHCYAEQSQEGGKAGDKYKKLADDEMAAATALLEHDQSDRVLGQLAIVYVEWGETDERMGDSAGGQSHRQQARETVKKMRHVDPTVSSIVGQIVAQAQPTAPPPRPTLKEEDLPRTPEGDTYFVSFPEAPDEAAALILGPPDKHGSYAESAGVLYVYQGNLFSEADDLYSVTTVGSRLARLVFQESVPIPPGSGSETRIQLVWTIEKIDKDSMTGVQSRVARPPRRFIARLASRQGDVASSKSN